MSFEFLLPLAWIEWGAGLVGIVSLFFGTFTAVWPRRSIGLYQWLMAQINWRVSPIDEAREVRTTRYLGIWLILLGTALSVIFFLESGLTR